MNSVNSSRPPYDPILAQWRLLSIAMLAFGIALLFGSFLTFKM